MGYGAKRKIGEPCERSAVWELDFFLRPRPHLGACSKATYGLIYANNRDI